MNEMNLQVRDSFYVLKRALQIAYVKLEQIEYQVFGDQFDPA